MVCKSLYQFIITLSKYQPVLNDYSSPAGLRSLPKKKIKKRDKGNKHNGIGNLIDEKDSS
jgi:hypothetical protein